jgi:hypothetical protein
LTETVVLKISPAAAFYVAVSTPREEKLRAARWEVPFAAADLVSLLLFLSYDRDDEVKGAAIKSLRELPESVALQVADAPDTPTKVLELLARLHYGKSDLAMAIVAHPSTDVETMSILEKKGVDGAAEALQIMTSDDQAVAGAFDEEAADSESEVDDEDVESEVSEEYLSKYKMAQTMGVGEKIKMALTGDKEWRSILVKDPNKLVCGSVIKNPRITEAEVLTLVKTGVQSDEIMRLICANKEWVKNYQIRKALVGNHKTPLPNALRYMATLVEKDLATLAKSKNVSSVISGQARRVLLQKQKHR